MNARVKGVWRAINLSHIGTIKWSFQDNEGRSQTFIIKDSFYAPNAPCRLLSPQHWSQNSNDNTARSKGTWSATYDDKFELHWDNNTYQRTVNLDKSSNITAICSSPGNMQYKVYSALHEVTVDCYLPVYFNTQVVMDDEESYSDSTSKPQSDDASVEGVIHQHGSDHNQEVFDFKDQPGTSTMDQLEQEIKPATKLLQIHQSLNHLLFKVIQLMAANGHYSKKLVDCQIPKCAACLFGKSTRRPWRIKSQQTGASKLCTFPGQCVSVDQLESLTPGLIAQMKGILTTKRYMAATIFINHFSRLSFVHLQSTLSSEDTIQAKKAFERYTETHGVKIIHYHADNGSFVDHVFIEDIKLQNQQVTYCSVNAHFQNGVAEKCI